MKIPWRRVGLVVLGGGVTALGALFPPAAPVAALVGPGLLGMALPSEWAGKVASTIVGLVRRR